MTHPHSDNGCFTTEPDAFPDMLGYRESTMPDAGGSAEATSLEAHWSDLISLRAHDFIVGWETGGRAFYEQVIKSRPVWPEFASGVTIGCGYDLGYHTEAQFLSDWQGRIAEAAIERLRPMIGFKTTEPDRTLKVRTAKALIAALADISVPWDTAIAQFDEAKMPRLVAQLYGSLDNLDRLHPHARGALLSLVFNRGSGGFTSAKDRFREMAAIRALMASGTRDDIARIPDLLRAMTRIWGDASSLARRRREEAALFEAGMAEAGLTESLAAFTAHATPETPAGLAEDHADVEDLSDNTDDTPPPMTEAPGPSLESVRWNPNDDEQPDYRHLPKPGAGLEFTLIAADIETLLRANSFEPLPGRLVFALRGARILGADKREDVTSVALADQRPDHRDYRCVIGVLDRATGRIRAYRASTVPEAKALLTCFMNARQGVALSGNILPTGLYTYTVGTHRAGTSGEIRGVLRLSRSASGASRVMALRSLGDLVYDRHDFWHDCAPADNIHPGRRKTGFSSLGCLTLPGDYDRATRRHLGLWADFRVALGMGSVFDDSDDGRQFSVMLLTGTDAALAATLREAGDGAGLRRALTRLRFGSSGPQVARLQAQLGLSPDASQTIGPVTLGALIGLQQRRLGWADGILSPEMQADLGLSVLE